MKKRKDDHWRINGNARLKYMHSYEEALELASTLVNCVGCLECSHCTNCTECKFCTNCTWCDRYVNCNNKYDTLVDSMPLLTYLCEVTGCVV